MATCNRCGRRGLHWGFRLAEAPNTLYDPDYSEHKCDSTATRVADNETTPREYVEYMLPGEPH